ncbi:MAG: MOSC domain-containing protein [Deltaproteobacteria bacterium]|nr:MOSC domain-containing protein [Deltaproteobacteria bacterium]MBI3389211.1 MOSC domain-containing protein [Deltaproteobacteria bacterium]
MQGRVIAVGSSPTHSFSKSVVSQITLLAGLGIEGDAHCGVTVKHRSRVAQDPTQPNLRQVHLIHSELFEELKQRGFAVAPGQLGENITTRGVDLLALPVGSALHIGPSAIVVLTGLRNPCIQLDHFQSGLMSAVLDRAVDGTLMRKAGVMGIVVASGTVHLGAPVNVRLPAEPHRTLERV